jgi:hypothetical protein
MFSCTTSTDWIVLATTKGKKTELVQEDSRNRGAWSGLEGKNWQYSCCGAAYTVNNCVLANDSVELVEDDSVVRTERAEVVAVRK